VNAECMSMGSHRNCAILPAWILAEVMEGSMESFFDIR
jgi:hypothetical protein